MSLPSKERFRCEVLSWGRVVRDAKRLSQLIKDSGYHPDIIIAIGRGGYVPARIICDYLILRDLTSIKVEHWGIAATERKEAEIKFPLCADIKDRDVLVVDDVTDTGDTLRVSIEYLRTFKPGEIKTAVLIHKVSSSIIPDFYVKSIRKWRWVIFPWHLYEDLTGFVRRLKDMNIQKEEDIIRELRVRYSISVNRDTLKEVISEIRD